MDILKAIEKNPSLKKKVVAAGSEMFNGFVGKHGVHNIKWGIIVDEVFELSEGDKVGIVIECDNPDGLVQAIRDTVAMIGRMKNE